VNAPLQSLDHDFDPRREVKLDFEDETQPGTVFAQVVSVAAILRRRWLVVALCMVLCLCGAAAAIKLVQPKWRANATILLHMSGPKVLDKVHGVSDDDEERRTGYRDYYETQRQIMGSRAVAERALSALGLAHDPQFLGMGEAKTEAEQAEQAARIAATDPVERLRTLMSVAAVKDSRIVRLSVDYPDPEVAADIVNAVTDAYVEYVQTSRARLGVDAQADIADEKSKAERRLEASEKAFEAFKQTHALTSMDQLEAQTTQGIATLNEHSKQVEAERIRLQSLLEEAQALHKRGNRSAANLLLGDSTLFESMRAERVEAGRAFVEVDVKYGPKHEEHRKAKRRLDHIDSSLDRESDGLVESLGARLSAARTVEGRINRSLGAERKQALRLSELEREYRALEREAKAAADDYLLIARRDTEIGITNRVEEEGIEILDRAAVPTFPVSPKKVVIVGMALIAGLGLGMLLAVGIDVHDERIRGMVDLERALGAFGLPVLGRLPQLPPDTRLGAGDARGQRKQRDLYAHVFPQSLMAERCRGIRTSLAFGAGGETFRSLMVTSPSPAEGKSSTAMNLAVSFCQANRRVVLIDADMRRPRIHQVFSEASSIGLSAVLQGDCDVEEALVRAPDGAPENLSIMPCGAVPENPVELLETAAFRDLVVALREHCDLVIVDSPPVLPVTDPVVLARHVDGVVLVGRSGGTTRGELQAAVAQLARGDTNVVGVVLNEVVERDEGYGYARRYHTYRVSEVEAS